MKGLALVLALMPLAASAATITVNTTADNATAGDSRCTLREAIGNVNAAADTTSGDCVPGSGTGDAIIFSLALPATIHVSAALGVLTIQRGMSIAGPQATALRLDGGHKTGVLDIQAGTVALSGITIQGGGLAPPFVGLGAGITIENGALVTLASCIVRGNEFSGIDNGGVLAVDDCTFRTSHSAINNFNSLTAIGSVFRRNYGGYGGAVFNAGSAEFTGTSFIGNLTRDQGGAVYNSGSITLTNCTLDSNRAIYPGNEGGLFNTGTATIANCTFKRNRQVVIGNEGDAKVTNSTFSNNLAWAGAVVVNVGGTVSLINCTLRGNRGHRDVGGGIGGGAILSGSSPSSVTILKNTILIKSGAGGACQGGPITDAGHNLVDDENQNCGFVNNVNGNQVGVDPMLLRLKDNGGATETMALCAGLGTPSRSCTGASPAIDAGEDAVTGLPDNLTTDQRGLPRLSGAHVDIGAYEVQQ